ncbi:MAG: UPF0280 family protein [Desulfobulbus sp.]|nr:MAG: UPF0280 family protein [Desulfobulbus sp.]
MAASPLYTKTPLSYSDRSYRRVENSGLVSSIVKIAETDVHILAPIQVEDQALQLIGRVRSRIERYIREHPVFQESLVPLPMDENAPEVIRRMLAAGLQAGVGPMAAVAGVIAAVIGRGLQDLGIGEVIVENGGDLYVARKKSCTVAVYAGESPLSGKLGISLLSSQMPCGVCCSSGTIGHSLSLGEADAVVVVARSTPLADAAATRLANEVDRGNKSIKRALQTASEINDLSGVVVISGDKLGAWGKIELVRL